MGIKRDIVRISTEDSHNGSPGTSILRDFICSRVGTLQSTNAPNSTVDAMDRENYLNVW